MFISDINECMTDITNNCNHRAYCENTIGSFRCHCMANYTGNGTHCKGEMSTLRFVLVRQTQEQCAINGLLKLRGWVSVVAPVCLCNFAWENYIVSCMNAYFVTRMGILPECEWRSLACLKIWLKFCHMLPPSFFSFNEIQANKTEPITLWPANTHTHKLRRIPPLCLSFLSPEDSFAGIPVSSEKNIYMPVLGKNIFCHY